MDTCIWQNSPSPIFHHRDSFAVTSGKKERNGTQHEIYFEKGTGIHRSYGHCHCRHHRDSNPSRFQSISSNKESLNF